MESARIDPSNTEILIQHLKCAAFELPFLRGEPYASEPADTGAALDYLAGHGVVHASGDRYHWSADAYPANHVSLRTVGWDNFVIIDKSTGSAIAELDFRATHTMLHEQAIYQHDGEQYQVEKLDYENHKAFVTKVVPDYFTTALSNRRVSVIDETARAPLGRAEVAWGEVSVIEKVVGYKKIKFHTHENAGYGDVRLPDIQKHTTSFWLTVPEPLCVELGRSGARRRSRGCAASRWPSRRCGRSRSCAIRAILGRRSATAGRRETRRRRRGRAGGGLRSHPLPLRQRARRRGPRRAHPRARRRAPGPRPEAGAGLRLSVGLPALRGRDRGAGGIRKRATLALFARILEDASAGGRGVGRGIR